MIDETTVLARRSWGDAKVYYKEDLMRQDILEIVLSEFESRELEITYKGFEFLEKYYSVAVIADWYLGHYKNWSKKQDVIDWWENQRDNNTY